MRSPTRFPRRCRIERDVAGDVDDYGVPTTTSRTVYAGLPVKAVRTDLTSVATSEVTVGADVLQARWLLSFPGRVDVSGRDRVVFDDVADPVTLHANGPAEHVRQGNRTVTTRIKASSSDVYQTEAV